MKKYVYIGIVAFLVIVTYPFWSAGKAKKPEPKLDTPEIQKLVEKKCVEPKEFMKREHMKLLNQWRDAALRSGTRVYVNSEGKEFTVSLQNTCMKCHSNKKKFCDECHNYAGVKPYCWDCHIAPKEEEEGQI